MSQQCPFCGLQVQHTAAHQEYLKDEIFVNFVKAEIPTWKPEHGICEQCLEKFYSAHNSSRKKAHKTDEPTVIVEKDRIPVQKEDQNQRGCLVTIHGQNMGKRYELINQEKIVGRSMACEIRVNEENVSRQHARIYFNGTNYVVEDLNSTNGTFLNTKKVTSSVLSDGDLVMIGNTILKYISGQNFENRYHEELYRLATIDGLTRVYNKAFFQEKLQEEFKRAKRYKRELSFILFDLDHFHNLNNDYGHLAGDYVLKTMCANIQNKLRKNDFLCRYGGEEFAIILPEIKGENALVLAEKIRKMVETMEFNFEGEFINVTISVGVSTLSAETEKASSLVKTADDALYSAKNGGRNKVGSGL
ncbi:MAG: GGDEF domain-containing protein [Bdellovibrionales bacterium]|nr:GGDEF domain-containing protein [Bdellovibrionales bacterium]